MIVKSLLLLLLHLISSPVSLFFEKRKPEIAVQEARKEHWDSLDSPYENPQYTNTTVKTNHVYTHQYLSKLHYQP